MLISAIINLLLFPYIMPLALIGAAGIFYLAFYRISCRFSGYVALAAFGGALFRIWLFHGDSGVYSYGSWLQLRLDYTSWVMMICITMSVFLIFVCRLENASRRRREQLLTSAISLVTFFSVAALLAGHFIIFALCWIIVGLLISFIAAYENRSYSNFASGVIITLFSALLLFIGLMLLSKLNKSLRIDITRIYPDKAYSYLAFCFLALAPLFRAAVWPFFYAKNSEISSMLLVSVERILNIYLLVRIFQDVFYRGELFRETALNLTTLACGAAFIAVAAIFPLRCISPLRIISWVALGQLGFIILGLGTNVAIAIGGSLLYSINTFVCLLCLCMCVNMFNYNGSIRSVNVKTLQLANLLISAFTMAAIPLSGTFGALWMICCGAFRMGKYGPGYWIVWVGILMLGILFMLGSMIKLVTLLLIKNYGKSGSDNSYSNKDYNSTVTTISTTILALSCIVLGILPNEIQIKYFLGLSSYINQIADTTGIWNGVKAYTWLTFLLIIAFTLGIVILTRRKKVAL